MNAKPAGHPVLFTFWEPRDEMPAYLRLCLQTWGKNLPGYDIVVLDYRNLPDYLPDDRYELSVLKRLRLPMQKDAVMVAVLEENGGTFMDVDTLVFRDISPVISELSRSEAVMFGMHCGFVAVRPGAELLAFWRAGIQERLRRVEPGGLPATGLKWDYLANSALKDALESIVDHAQAREPIRARAMGSSARLVGKLERRRDSWGPTAQRVIRRLGDGFANRRLTALFGTVLRERLTMLDPRRAGFIAERSHFRSRLINPLRKYQRFWFEDDLDVDEVTRRHPVVVGLHHSWTPEWYAALSEEEVLRHHCLLSRTLRHALTS